MSVGFYFRRTQEAKVDASASAEIVWAKSYHDSPLLIQAFAEKLRPLGGRKVLFTVHSLPEKALADIAGLPMVARVWLQAAKAKTPSRVIVATDNERIAAAVRAVGGEAMMPSPAHPSGTAAGRRIGARAVEASSVEAGQASMAHSGTIRSRSMC